MNEDLVMQYINQVYKLWNYDYITEHNVIGYSGIAETSTTTNSNFQNSIDVESLNQTIASINATASSIQSNYVTGWIPLYSYDVSIDSTGTIQYNSSILNSCYYTPTNYVYNPWVLCEYDTPIDKKRREIKEQLTIIVSSRSQELRDIPENECTAMRTLRDMITETEYRKYIRDGFISVRGQSGKVYQVFRNRAHTKVFFKGELVEEICVRLKGDNPPTDNVIAFKTMIEFDEEYFASLGNRYNMRQAA